MSLRSQYRLLVRVRVLFLTILREVNWNSCCRPTTRCRLSKDLELATYWPKTLQTLMSINGLRALIRTPQPTVRTFTPLLPQLSALVIQQLSSTQTRPNKQLAALKGLHLQ